MFRVLETIFAALVGLAFGSFLNVCASRWPEGESIVTPRSHCRSCGRTIAWWENVPLVSWIALRGRCRTCGAWIGWRYPLVELAVGALWGYLCWRCLGQIAQPNAIEMDIYIAALTAAGDAILCWLLIALAVFDAEHLWLPDRITLPGTALGLIDSLGLACLESLAWFFKENFLITLEREAVSIAICAGLILAIRWVYWLIRRREGVGLGDAKLMMMIAAWLGSSRGLLTFGLGVVLGACVAVIALFAKHKDSAASGLATMKLPLGTFLSVGGIVSALWGDEIVRAWLHWAGL